jgi:hypothetical protein
MAFIHILMLVEWDAHLLCHLNGQQFHRTADYGGILSRWWAVLLFCTAMLPLLYLMLRAHGSHLHLVHVKQLLPAYAGMSVLNAGGSPILNAVPGDGGPGHEGQFPVRPGACVDDGEGLGDGKRSCEDGIVDVRGREGYGEEVPQAVARRGSRRRGGKKGLWAAGRPGEQLMPARQDCGSGEAADASGTEHRESDGHLEQTVAAQKAALLSVLEGEPDVATGVERDKEIMALKILLNAAERRASCLPADERVP